MCHHNCEIECSKKPIIVEYPNKSLDPIKYSTTGAIGIDIPASYDVVIPPNNYFSDIENILKDIVKNIKGNGGLVGIEPKIDLLQHKRYMRHMIPLNIKVQYPKGYWGLLVPRSSLFKEKGLMMSNGVGIIDNDFCKQHFFPVVNLTNEAVEIKEGELVAQLLILPYEQFSIIEGTVQQHENHNGEGSTGGYKK